MDWAYVRRAWEKWASVNVGSSGEPLKAALLINYDPSGPSRMLSTIAEQKGINVSPIELGQFVNFIRHNNLQTESFIIGTHQWKSQYYIKGAHILLLKKYSYKDMPLQKVQYSSYLEVICAPRTDMVTSIHENWFSGRCLNTSKPAGEGVIVIQTSAFLLVALYDGSIGPASCAMATVDQFAWQLSRRNL